MSLFGQHLVCIRNNDSFHRACASKLQGVALHLTWNDQMDPVTLPSNNIILYSYYLSWLGLLNTFVSISVTIKWMLK